MGLLDGIINFLRKITKKDLLYGLIIALLFGLLCISINTCSNNRAEYENNIIALNDTIHYYQGKNGNLVATIRGFESSVKDLKLLNKDLYNKIDELKAKGNVTNGTWFNGVIENPKNDTTYIVLHDTIVNGFEKNFAFNNDYRILEGNVIYKNDTVGININKDQVKFDYTVAMDDKNNIMIHSDNPYVKFNEITGFQIPKQKKKHWSLGPGIGFGYDPIQKKPSFTVNVSLNYSLLRW